MKCASIGRVSKQKVHDVFESVEEQEEEANFAMTPEWAREDGDLERELLLTPQHIHAR
jgi:hypothetical protein